MIKNKKCERANPYNMLVAVIIEGNLLCVVIEQTPEICLAASIKDDNALQYVKKQTFEICL